MFLNRTWAIGKRKKGFSVIELMMAVAIMGVIIYALYSVFNQTQRALRSSEIQGDVSEKARAIMEMVARELEQAHPTFHGNVYTNSGFTNEINLAAWSDYPPMAQKAERADIRPRTNILADLFFLNRETNAWIGVGYRVNDVRNGVGVLERFQTNTVGHVPRWNEFMSAFVSEQLKPTNDVSATNFHHIADGVVHFKLIPYDPVGYPLAWNTTNVYPGYRIYREFANNSAIPLFSNVTNRNFATVLLRQSSSSTDAETFFTFSSNAMPAYLELELAMLEPETLRQYYTMVSDGNMTAATNFLARQITKVHLFRQRIPIRTAAQ